MPPQAELQQRLQAVEQLIAQIESAADPRVRSTVRELMQLVMELHGAGLERMLELIRGRDGGENTIQALGRDELVAGLLALYDLHPLDLEARVAQALDNVRPRLRAYEGEVELLAIQDGSVRLRLHANGHGCGSGADALKEMVEAAVYQAAPDLTTLVIEGGEKQAFVPLGALLGKTAAAPVLAVGEKAGAEL